MSLHLRLATEADAPAIAAIYAPAVLETAISFEIIPPSADEMVRRIREVLPALPWLVCELGGEVAGYAYASRHQLRHAYQWAVDSSVYVHGNTRRSGVARALYTALLELLALQGYYRVCAGIALPNPASVGLHEALGFHSIGVYPRIGYKMGMWHDVGWWQRDLRTTEGQPAPTLPLEALGVSTITSVFEKARDAALCSSFPNPQRGR